MAEPPALREKFDIGLVGEWRFFCRDRGGTTSGRNDGQTLLHGPNIAAGVDANRTLHVLASFDRDIHGSALGVLRQGSQSLHFTGDALAQDRIA